MFVLSEAREYAVPKRHECHGKHISVRRVHCYILVMISFHLNSTSTSYLILILGTLTDAHIWDLAQRITDIHQLLDLGLKILKVQGYRVDAAVNNETEIQLAALRILKIWFNAQPNRQEAYRHLLSGLRECQYNQLASNLQQWVEGAP